MNLKDLTRGGILLIDNVRILVVVLTGSAALYL
jgi:hypothetical protein